MYVFIVYTGTVRLLKAKYCVSIQDNNIKFGWSPKVLNTK